MINLPRVGLPSCDARCTSVLLRFWKSTLSARDGFSRFV